MIRAARPEEAAAIARVELASWPPGLAMDEAAIAARLAAFPQGQLVEDEPGEVIAYAAAQRQSQAAFDSRLGSYATLTDQGRLIGTHDPAGDVYQLIGVAVDPSQRRSRLARRLVDAQIERARATPGVRRILGVTRPMGYHRRPDLPIEEYVELRDADGKRIDPLLSFHIDNGARLVQILPAFRPEDDQARGYGVLIEYPV